jgi:hypothetical protein
MNLFKTKAAEVIVKEMPQGFFLLRREGLPDVQAFNHPAFGLMAGVKSSFYCGGLLFQRERDQRGKLVPLRIFVMPHVKTLDAYGDVTRDGKRFVDTWACLDGDGEFPFTPLR